MNISLKNALPIHFPISLKFINRFLHASAKSRGVSEAPGTKATGHGSDDIRFFEDEDDMETYVRSFQMS